MDQKKIFTYFAIVVLLFIGGWFLYLIPFQRITIPQFLSSHKEGAVVQSPASSFVEKSSTAGSASMSDFVAARLTEDITNDFVARYGTSTEGKEKLIQDLKNGGLENYLKTRDLSSYLNETSTGYMNEMSDDQIRITPDSADARATYLSSYGAVMTTFALSQNTDKFTVAMRDFMDTQSSSLLDNIISSYASAYEGLKQVLVPASLADFHKKNLMYLYNMKATLSDIKFMYSDPIRAYVAVNKVSELSAQWDEIATQLKKLK